MKVVEFQLLPSKQDALDSLDALRRKIDSGDLIAFVAVGFDSDDVTEGYLGTSKPVSRLRMMGALAELNRAFTSGEFGSAE